MFYETTTELLLARQEAGGIHVEVSGGQSFIDVVIGALKVPVNEGFQVLDGTALAVGDLDFNKHTLITQVYEALCMGEVRLSLLEIYPPETLVQLVDAYLDSTSKI